MRAISKQIATAAGDSSDEMREAQAKAQKRKEKIENILSKIRRKVYEEEITEEQGEADSAEYKQELLQIENTLQALKSALRSAITPESVYLYLQELLSLYGSNNDELTKHIFDKLIDRIEVYDDRIALFLVVNPFATIGDCAPQGQPHAQLSAEIDRKELKKRV